MAPDTTGDPFGDSVRSCLLCQELLDRFPHWLRRGGHCTMKVFEGVDYPALLRRAQVLFDEAKGFKPRSSRAESVEMFLVCKGYRTSARRKTSDQAWLGYRITLTASP